MFKLGKALISLALLAGFVVFGFTVKLGERTLFGHLRAIAGAKETQDLVHGTEQAARPVIDRVRGKTTPGPDAGDSAGKPVPASGAPGPADKVLPSGPTGAVGAPPAGAKPADTISDQDRKKLRDVLGGSVPVRKDGKPAKKGK